jgi:hypothetical protein
VRVRRVEPLNCVFRNEYDATAGCILDSCGFVHLIAERGDFESATMPDLSDADSAEAQRLLSEAR